MEGYFQASRSTLHFCQSMATRGRSIGDRGGLLGRIGACILPMYIQSIRNEMFIASESAADARSTLFNDPTKLWACAKVVQASVSGATNVPTSNHGANVGVLILNLSPKNPSSLPNGINNCVRCCRDSRRLLSISLQLAPLNQALDRAGQKEA